jgi:hypothetical protein
MMGEVVPMAGRVESLAQIGRIERSRAGNEHTKHTPESRATACLNLAAARLRYIVGTAWSTKCYMNMWPLYQPQLRQTEAVA